MLRHGLLLLLAAILAAAETPVLLRPAAGAEIRRGDERIACPDAAAALRQARDGDIVVLAPGTHRGPLVVDRAGVTLRGEPGAQVDGSAAWTPAWTPEPTCGPHAWSSPIPFEPDTVTCDGRALIDARESRGGLALHALGVGRAGRGALGGVFTWLKAQKRLVLSFAGPDDPARHRIAAAASATAAITVRGADRCTVEGVVVTGGHDGILLEATSGSSVRACLVYACDVAIRLGPGAAACRVLGNDVTLHMDAINVDCDLDSGLAADDVWGAHKNFGTYDKTGISADRAGAGNEIAGNYLYDVWDGIENGNGVGKEGIRKHHEEQVLKGTADANRDLRVHHNRIDLAMDDALSPGNDLVGNRWHSNLVTRARCAVRFKTPNIGPFHFFDNVLVDCGDGLRIYKTSPACATVVIHNNVVIHPDGVIYHNLDQVAWDDPWLAKQLPRGSPGYRIYNNIFVSDRQFTNQGGAVTPDFAADGNLFTCARDPMPALQARDHAGLFGVRPVFTDPAHGDWGLQPGSPGLGAGLPFASFATPAALPAGWTAPEHPDIGLLHIAPEQTPHGPVSGLWSVADAALGLTEHKAEDIAIAADRWQLLGKGGFVVTPTDQAGRIARITLLRAADRAKDPWTVEAVAADGTVLAHAAGGPPGLQAITLAIDPPAAGPVELRIDDQAKARWRVDDQGAALRVGLRSGAAIQLAKYDGGAYALDCAQAAGGAGFTVALRRDFDGECSAVVVHPDGQREALPASGVVATGGLAGTWRLLLTFTKRAWLEVAPAGQPLWLVPQERSPLRARWHRPIY